jgi:hypothetical protein
MQKNPQISDHVLIKTRKLKGTVVGQVLVTNNKAQAGDLIVSYKDIVRGNEADCRGYFRPDELELVIDNG